MVSQPDESPAWSVVCLCAEWCGVCRSWRSLFEEAAAAQPGVRFGWIDVEDEAEAMGDVDIETFPTLLVAHGSQPRFLGPVQPSAAQVLRLLQSLQSGGATLQDESGARELWSRIASRVLLIR